MELDSPLEAKILRISLPLENFHFHRLSEKEVGAVQDKEDYPLLSVIYGLSSKDLDLIYHTIFIDSKNKSLFHDYMFKQEKWLEDFRYYYCMNKHQDVSCTNEFCESLREGPTKTYRLYFAAKHPDKVDFCEKVQEGCEKTMAFLFLCGLTKEISENQWKGLFVD